MEPLEWKHTGIDSVQYARMFVSSDPYSPSSSFCMVRDPSQFRTKEALTPLVLCRCLVHHEMGWEYSKSFGRNNVQEVIGLIE